MSHSAARRRIAQSLGIIQCERLHAAQSFQEDTAPVVDAIRQQSSH